MYEKLISSLRICHGMCEGSGFEEAAKLLTQAADAIEELTQKEKFHAFLWNTIQPNEMELYIAMYRAQAVPQEPSKEELK